VEASELRVIPKTIRELNQFSEQQVYEKLRAGFKQASLQVQVSGYLGADEERLRNGFGVQLREEPGSGELMLLVLRSGLIERDPSIGPNSYVSVIGTLQWYRYSGNGNLVMQVDVAKIWTTETPKQKLERKSNQAVLSDLRALNITRQPFPLKETVSISVIHPANNVALSDFRSKIEQLGPYASIESIPLSAMRPEFLVESICKAQGDIVAIVRGGLEGMDAFDDKNVAAALARKRAYRVLGIGHKVTSSLLDLVPEYTADVPSDAGAHIAGMAENVLALIRKLDEAQRLRDQPQQLPAQLPVTVEVVKEVVPRWAYAVIMLLTIISALLVFVRLLQHRP
jgi:exonuclease VII large subunit